MGIIMLITNMFVITFAVVVMVNVAKKIIHVAIYSSAGTFLSSMSYRESCFSAILFFAKSG